MTPRHGPGGSISDPHHAEGAASLSDFPARTLTPQAYSPPPAPPPLPGRRALARPAVCPQGGAMERLAIALHWVDTPQVDQPPGLQH